MGPGGGDRRLAGEHLRFAAKRAPPVKGVIGKKIHKLCVFYARFLYSKKLSSPN
jgi:hypothetical protein